MSDQYKILTSVTFSHEYNMNAGAAFMKPLLAKGEAAKLSGMGLFFKATAGGFCLIYNASLFNREDLLSAGDTNTLSDAALEKAALLRVQPLSDRLVVHIDLWLNDDRFFNYTAYDGGKGSFQNISASVFYFTNTRRSATLTNGAALLHREAYASVQDQRAVKDVNSKDKDGKPDFDPRVHYPARFFSKPFGTITLKLLPFLKEQYAIRFDNKRSLWKYIIVTEELGRLLDDVMDAPAKLAIVNIADEKAFNDPVYTVAERGRRLITFTSKDPLPAMAMPDQKFRMVSNYDAANKSKWREIIRLLPTADAGSVSRMAADSTDEQNYSEIYL